DVALSNARDAAPDTRIVEEQRRRVNGTDVVMLRLEGKTNGIAFTYLGYYYSSPSGTVQVITYTGQNLFQEYRHDFEDFLNGFNVRKHGNWAAVAPSRRKGRRAAGQFVDVDSQQ